MPNFIDLHFEENETYNVTPTTGDKIDVETRDTLVDLDIAPNDRFIFVCSQTTLYFISPALKVLHQVAVKDMYTLKKQPAIKGMSMYNITGIP